MPNKPKSQFNQLIFNFRAKMSLWIVAIFAVPEVPIDQTDIEELSLKMPKD